MNKKEMKRKINHEEIKIVKKKKTENIKEKKEIKEIKIIKSDPKNDENNIIKEKNLKKSEESMNKKENFNKWKKDNKIPIVTRIKLAVEAGFFTKKQVLDSYNDHLVAKDNYNKPLVNVSESGCWISNATPSSVYPRIMIKGSGIDIKFMLHHISMYLHGMLDSLDQKSSQEFDKKEKKIITQEVINVI